MNERDLYFEDLGDDFDRFMSDYDVSRRLRLIFEKLLPRPERYGKCLEVGCGTGRISEMAIGRVDELTVTDISRRLARGVGERLACAYHHADACNLRIDARTFDLVISSECIEHTRSPWRALSEMARVLRPGGLLVVTTPNRLWYPTVLAAQALRLRKFAGREQFIWPHEALRWLRRNNFDILRFGGCHLYPWQIPGSARALPFFDHFDTLLYPAMINFGFAARKG